MKRLTKDKRYVVARKLIISKKIKLFREIFDIVPKEVMADDLGIGKKKFENLIYNTGLFRMGQVAHMVELLQVEFSLFALILSAQHKADKMDKG